MPHIGELERGGANQSADTSSATAVSTVGSGEGWSVTNVSCRLSRHDRPLEDQFGRMTVAAVMDGTFRYRTTTGKAVLYPGAFLLGNANACFECAFDDANGDRCIAFNFDTTLFQEIAASSAGSHRFRFPMAMLPASRQTARLVVESALSVSGQSSRGAEELAIRLAENVVGVASGWREIAPSPTAREERRIRTVLRYIELHSDETPSLAALATMACMSKYHFLRSFRRIAGITPHQFLLWVRMHHAAVKVGLTSRSISSIAYETGFNDLSSFNERFKRVLGMNPGRFRASRAAMPAQA
jgi:AraC family transcriptional regulator